MCFFFLIFNKPDTSTRRKGGKINEGSDGREYRGRMFFNFQFNLRRPLEIRIFIWTSHKFKYISKREQSDFQIEILRKNLIDGCPSNNVARLRNNCAIKFAYHPSSVHVSARLFVRDPRNPSLFGEFISIGRKEETRRSSEQESWRTVELFVRSIF